MVNLKVKNFEWFVSGAVLGLLLSVILPVVNTIVGSAQVGITFSIYNIRGSLAAFQQGGTTFSNWLLQLAGLQWSIPGILMAMFGVGLLVLLSRYVLGWLKIPAKHMMLAVFTLASVLQGLIMSTTFNELFGQFSIEMVIFAGLTGLILAFLVKALYKTGVARSLKLQMPM